MSTVKKILDRLSGVKETASGWTALCPAHEDRRPSLSISEGEGGRVLVKCHRGCSTKEIVDALRLEERDLFDDSARRTPTPTKASAKKASTPKAEKKAGKTYATADEAQKAYERTLGPSDRVHCPSPKRYAYRDESGREIGRVLRWEYASGKKEIRPISLYTDGWRQEHMPTPRRLYAVEAIRAFPTARCFVVEGENKVAAAARLNVVATTSVGGSSSAKQSDWSPLAGRDVVILPDADEPGRKYAAEVAEILLALDPPAVVRIVDLAPDRDDGYDVADMVKGCNPLSRDHEALGQKIERLVDKTEPLAARPSTIKANCQSEERSSLVKASAAGGSEEVTTPVDAYAPFPVDALPEPLKAFVEEASAAIGVDPAYIGVPLLPIVGAAIGTTLRLELRDDGYSVPAIVWAAIVGSSGSGKSPALRAALAASREHDRELRQESKEIRREHEAEVDLYEASAAAWRKQHASGKSTEPPPERPEPPRGRRALVVDATTEALAERLADNGRGLLLARDELSGWLGSLNRYSRTGASADEAFFLSAYDGESHSIDRRTGDRREIDVPLAALWIVGGIQAGVLQRGLTAERREAGLLARFLLTSPPARAAEWTEAEVSFATRQAYAELIAGLYRHEHEIDDQGREKPRLLRLDADAKKAYVAFFNRTSAELFELPEGDLKAALSKLRETAARIALILHAAKAEAERRVDLNVVDADSMSRAIRLAEWLRVETRRSYRLLGQTSEERAEQSADDKLLSWIGRQAEPVTPRDVVTGCRWIETADDAEAALRRFVDAGRGRWEDRPPGERGGRPTRHFVLDRQAATSTPEASSRPVVSAQLHETRPKQGFANADTADDPQTRGVVEL